MQRSAITPRPRPSFCCLALIGVVCSGAGACSGELGAPAPEGAFGAPTSPTGLPPNTTIGEDGVVTDAAGNVVGVAQADGTVVDPTTGQVIGSAPPDPANGASGVGTPDSPVPATPSGSTPPATAGSPEAPVVNYSPPTPEAPELPARTWRLTHQQYAASVRAVVGVEPDLTNFAPELGNGMFVNYSSTNFVRVDLADNYFDTAKAVAQSLTQQQLAGLTDCNLQAACADSFIESMAMRAFRRPANPSEVAQYRSLYDAGAADGDALAGFRAVVQGLLNSPLFLYRTEVGASADEAASTFQLTDYEVASLLSYSLLNGPPSQSLLDAAAAGELTNPATLPAHVSALMSDPAATGQLRHFLSEWLEVHHFQDVEKFEDSFPGFATVKDLIEEETAAFLAQSGTSSSTLSNLLLDPVPSVGPSLDQFYFSDPSAPATGERNGVLALGAVLSHHAKPYLTSPTLRGTFVRKRFFCQEITLPPGFTPPPLSETESQGVATTTRDLYERHQTDPSCSGCHRLTDNIGFVMEAFDGAGRFRTIDVTQGAAEPIDPSAMLTDSDVNRPMSTVAELSQAISESELVTECLARQAYRFYFGQGETSRGLPPIINAHQSLQQSGQLGHMLASLMSTDSTFARVRQ